MTVDPGHFHAYLVQKYMYQEVNPIAYVYAPAGPEVEQHLEQIEQFNRRQENPTHWQEIVYLGQDYWEKMLQEKPGNLLILAGNNAKKAQYIHQAIEAGINVLADKPMVINPDDYPLLVRSLKTAEENGLLLYDIMTERFEITTVLQKALSAKPEVFGTLKKGTPDKPAIFKESVHHFFKEVAGSALKRPAWSFDIGQQGAGIVDVSTHLVDLMLWECFPEQSIYPDDVTVIQAKTWSTKLTPQQFRQVTRESRYPDYLKRYIAEDSLLDVLCNGEFTFAVRGIHGKVSVIWNFEAPSGAKDTHFSIMRGSLSNLVIRQGVEQNYLPTLCVEPGSQQNIAVFEHNLRAALEELSDRYPGLDLKTGTHGFEIMIPDRFRVGHEAHFNQVTEQYLEYLNSGSLPTWEIQNMLTKYFITMEAYRKSNPK